MGHRFTALRVPAGSLLIYGDFREPVRVSWSTAIERAMTDSVILDGIYPTRFVLIGMDDAAICPNRFGHRPQRRR
jgi:hypothetical protein